MKIYLIIMYFNIINLSFLYSNNNKLKLLFYKLFRKQIYKIYLTTKINNLDFNKFPKLWKIYLPKNIDIIDNDLIIKTNIRKLFLNYNRNITDTGLQYLKGIKHLILWENKNITDTGLQYLKGAEEVWVNNEQVI